MHSTPIGVGAVAAGFTLEDQHKNKVTLSDARGKSPVVLVFLSRLLVTVLCSAVSQTTIAVEEGRKRKTLRD
jgi:peroxiredoxin